MSESASDAGRKDSIHKVLAHPLRAHLLMKIAEEGQLSPNEIHRAESKLSLNTVSYHIKVLERYGALELSETKKRRGATEHFYSIPENSPILMLILASMLMEEELIPGSRPKSLLLPLRLDSQGAGEVRELMTVKFAKELRGIEAQAGERLESSGSTEVTYLHAGLGILTNPGRQA